MPLDEFQKSIVEVIRVQRDAESPFAGGSVIQQHGIRLSNDPDIFTSGDLDAIMRLDTQALAAAGYEIIPGNSFSGFRECIVAKPMIGRTTLQWGIIYLTE